MELMIKLLIVLGLGAIELWVAIPTGFVLQLHPLVTGIMAASGAILGMLVVLAIGERIRTWLIRRHSGKEDLHNGRIYSIWNRYGVAGLGLLAPLLIGAPLGTAIGITLGTPAYRLLFWMTLGIVLCSAGLTLASVLGLAGINAMGH